VKNPSNYPHFLRKLWWNSVRETTKSKQTSAEAEGGYALMMTSAMTVMLFGLIAAYMSITELNRTSTKANTSARNTIVASQSGLNLEANRIRDLLKDGQIPYGVLPGNVSTASATNMRFCLDNDNTNDGSGDYQCRYYYFDHQGGEDRRIGATAKGQLTRYIAAAFLTDTTNYQPDGSVLFARIPADEPFGGLNALPYRYNSFSMAFSTSAQDSSTKPTVNAATAVDGTDAAIVDSLSGRNGQIPLAQTVMQMQFTNYVIPLFQFAAFYSDDLEINSTTRMVLNGPVHTNGALFVEPTPNNVATGCNDTTGQMTLFQGNVTAVSGVYNWIQSSVLHRQGITCFQTGETTYLSLNATHQTPRLTPADIGAMNGMLKEGPTDVKKLTPPTSGSLQPFNASNAANEYYAAADLRIIMRPSRGQTDAANVAKAIPGRDAVPFDFQILHKGSVSTNAAVSCLPADDTRDNPSPGKDINCRQLTAGALRSLMHPVLVMPQASASINSSQKARFCQDNPSAIVPNSADSPPTLPITGTDPAWDYILKAMTIAIASDPRAIPLDYMSVPFKDWPANSPVKGNFDKLLDASATASGTKLVIPGVPSNIGAVKAQIMELSPMQIAAVKNTCFLAPPVQWVSRWNYDSSYNNTGWEDNNGTQFYFDRREGRRMRLVQTNIESLTVWNRDGVFAPFPSDAVGNNPTPIADDKLQNMFNTPDSYSGNNTLFVRQERVDVAFKSSYNPGEVTFYKLGLGALDGFPINKLQNPGAETELISKIRQNTNNNGLVFHASLADDFDGDGTNDLTVSTGTNSRLYREPQTSGAGTGDINSTSTNTQTGISYFGFVVSGGRNLPAPLSFISDHSVYVQGDYNSTGSRTPATAGATTEEEHNKLPAAIMADTITNLSNNCNSAVDKTQANPVLTPAPTPYPHRNPILKTPVATLPTGTQLPRAQVDCGVVADADFASSQHVALETIVNAAYLSNTDTSRGNQNDTTGATTRYSGGLNNYMRMVENWAGRQFIYRGSFVSLSDRANGMGGPINSSGAYVFGGSSVTSYYMVPIRDFAYDTYFNSFANLPPMTPTVVYQKQNLLRREYEFSSLPNSPTSPANSVAMFGLPYRESRHSFNPFQLIG
jgi:hypothetical protein